MNSSTSLPDRYGLHFLRSLEPQAFERILKNDPGGRDEIDPCIPEALRFRREHGTVAVELVELSREFRRLPGNRMDPPSEGRVAEAQWELRDSTKEALLLRMDQEAVIRPAASVRLGEDATGPRMRVLDEGRRVPFEVQGLLPPERDGLLRLDPHDVVPDGRDPDRLGDLPLLGLGQVRATLRDLRVGAVEGLVNQVVEVHDPSLPRRHATLGQVHERVEDRLRSPINPHKSERGFEPLERELVILAEDVDRDIAPPHLAQMVRDVPRRVQGCPVLAHEHVLRGIAFEAERADVDEAGRILLLAQRHESLNDSLHAPVEDRVALPEEGIERHIHAAEAVEDALQDRLADLANVLRQPDVSALEPLGELLDLPLERLVLFEPLARLLVQLHVAVLEALLRILGLPRKMRHRPVQEDHLAADVVHQVLAFDREADESQQADESVPQERIPRAADVEGSCRIRTRVLQEDPLLLAG